MARTRNQTLHNFYIVNFSTLEKAINAAKIIDNNSSPSTNNFERTKLLEGLICSLPHIKYQQPFYAMKGFAFSEFDDYLILFHLNNDKKIRMFDYYHNGKLTPKFNDICFDEYRVLLSVNEPFESIYSLFTDNYVHPIYLTRFVELCEFDSYVNDNVLLKVLGDVYKDYLDNEDDEEEEEEENNEKEENGESDDEEENNEKSHPPLKKMKSFHEDKNRKLIEIIKRETHNIDWDDKLLEAFRKMLYLIDPIDSHQVESHPFNVHIVDLSSLRNNFDMIYCILEFIGNVKTLFNFVISCRDFYNIFLKANKNNLLLKRIIKDLGIVYF